MPASAAIADVAGPDILGGLGGADLLGAISDIAPSELAASGVAGADVAAAGADASLFAPGALAGDATGGLVGGLGGTDVLAATDALSALGGADAFTPAALGGVAPTADLTATLTPGATSLGGGMTGALGGATGAPMSATSALGLGGAADPSQLAFDVASATPTDIVTDSPTIDLGYTGLDPPTNLGKTALPPPAEPELPAPVDFGNQPTFTPPAETPQAPTAVGSFAQPATTPMDVSAPALPAGGGGGGGAGGGGGGLFGTGISGKDALMYGLAGAPLAMSLLRGEPGVPPQANQATALSPQEQALAAEMMTSVQQNRPTASQAAAVAQNSQNRLNAARQALFNQGVQNPMADSRWAAIVAQDQQQQLVETQQYMQQNMQDAMAAAGAAQSGLLSVAQMQAQQDQAYTNALSNAMKSAGTVLALGGAFGNKPVQPSVNIG